MEKLITAEKCYLSDTCKKFNTGECSNSVSDFCIYLYKVDTLYDLSLLSENQRLDTPLLLEENSVDLNSYYQLSEYKNNILDFVNAGTNLYIYSPITGNGKTSWAIKFIQAYIKKIWASSELTCRTLFINIPTFVRELKLNIENTRDYIQHINTFATTADIVVWDDIASKATTEYEHEQLLSLLDTRLDNNKSNIFTSNVIPNDLEKYIGTRLTSRILGTSTQICFQESDKRGWDK